MGKSSGESGRIEYAEYLEQAHKRLLDRGNTNIPVLSFIEAFNAIICKQDGFTDSFNSDLIESPYRGYNVEIDEGFFGITTDDPSVTYEPKNYPSLWDMFGKFIGGLDVHDLWGMVYSDVVQGPEIENSISAQSALLQDEIDTNVTPKIIGGLRDINSVQGTAFIVSKAIVQSAHVKSINKFSSDIRIHAIDVSNQQWSKHLEWNNSVISIYSEMFKLYYASRMDMDRANLEYQSKDLMWNVNLFENARGILGALSGAAATTGQNEPSGAQKAIGGALSGAAAGWKAGGPWGAAIGGVLGLGSSFL